MKERMKDELWIKKIKERLEDYSEPLPVSGWERLEKELPASKTSIAGGRRTIPFRHWAVAAAVLLVAVSSISFWLLQSPVGDEVRRANVSALAVVPDELPESILPSVQTNPAESLPQARGNSSITHRKGRSLVAQQVELPATAEQKNENLSSRKREGIDERQIGETAAVQAEPTETHKDQATENKKERRRPSKKDKLHLPVEHRSSSRTGGWSMGLSVGNTGGLGNLLGNDMDQSGPQFSGNSSSGRLDLSNTANSIVSIPNGQQVVFKDGMPYLMKRMKSIADIEHKQPLSFGVSVRKNLSKGFSVETGLTYTYLASDVTFDDGSDKVSQKLHYLGIPVRANWNFVDSKNFTMYVSGGGAVEKCVYGKIGSENETVKPVQLSVMGAVGAQYNVSNRVGIYVEPGVSYFFDDRSAVQTIRKENPCNFTLQAGFRLTY